MLGGKCGATSGRKCAQTFQRGYHQDEQDPNIAAHKVAQMIERMFLSYVGRIAVPRPYYWLEDSDKEF